MTGPGEPALHVERASHAFGGRTALRDVSVRVMPGCFGVLLGPNGAGKTTLVSLVTGLYRAQSGAIRVLGRDIARDPCNALARLGVVFQAPTLDAELSVAENLAYHAALHGLSAREGRDRAREELRRAGIAELRDRPVRELSGGQRRRVEIARALLHRPGLLLADEATAGLDLAPRRALLAHVRALSRDHGLAVLWATHLLDEVEEEDAVTVLQAGEVRFSGAARDLAGSGGLGAAFLRITGQAA